MFGETMAGLATGRRTLEMNCTHCRSPNLENRNYCGNCGAQLGHYCSLCGFRNHLSDRYCGGCGVAIAEGAQEQPRQPQATFQQQIPLPQVEPQQMTSPVDQGLCELLDIAASAQEEPEEKPDSKVTQDDIDSLFGN